MGWTRGFDALSNLDRRARILRQQWLKQFHQVPTGHRVPTADQSQRLSREPSGLQQAPKLSLMIEMSSEPNTHNLGGEIAKRTLDVLAALVGSISLALPSFAILVMIKSTSPGPILYWSPRVGRDGRIFQMPKFRTMKVGTPQVATDKLVDPTSRLTPISGFLRKLSLDEIPQLWSVLKGDMALVGPRPALFNQHELIAARKARGIDALRPGITGWAQINGRDNIPESRKVELDEEYLRRRSFGFDLQIMWLTAWRVIRRDGVSH